MLVRPDDARAFLRVHLGRHDVGPVELIGEGWWSRAFGFRDRDRDRVIRFGRHVDDFLKDRRAAAFRAPALPVPEVFEVGAAFDGYFAISTRAYGTPLESNAARGWHTVLPALFAALDALRAIDVSDDAGYGHWDAQGRARFSSWRDFLLAVELDTPKHRTHGWRQRLIDTPTGDAPFVAGLRVLRELADAFPRERYVVHGDLINRNVLVDGAQLTAVFDWGCSFYGDFLYDIAWLAFWEPWYPALTEIDVRGQARKHYSSIDLDVPDFEARVRACMIHIGLDHQAWNATTGDLDTLGRVIERTNGLLDGPLE
jgi:hygromycin-B 4-O-kinase